MTDQDPAKRRPPIPDDEFSHHIEPLYPQAEQFIRSEPFRLLVNAGLNRFTDALINNASVEDDEMVARLDTTVEALGDLQRCVQDGYEGYSVRQYKGVGGRVFITITAEEDIQVDNPGYLDFDRQQPIKEYVVALTRTDRGGYSMDPARVLEESGYTMEVFSQDVTRPNPRSRPEYQRGMEL